MFVIFMFNEQNVYAVIIFNGKKIDMRETCGENKVQAVPGFSTR